MEWGGAGLGLAGTTPRTSLLRSTHTKHDSETGSKARPSKNTVLTSARVVAVQLSRSVMLRLQCGSIWLHWHGLVMLVTKYSLRFLPDARSASPTCRRQQTVAPPAQGCVVSHAHTQTKKKKNSNCNQIKTKNEERGNTKKKVPGRDACPNPE